MVQTSKDLEYNYTPNVFLFFAHFVHIEPLVFVPHVTHCNSTPKISREGVLVAFMIKITTIRIPITIPINTRTITLYYTINVDIGVYRCSYPLVTYTQ